MSYKDEVNTAVHNYYHDDTELEIAAKDWLYEQNEKAELADKLINKLKDSQYYIDGTTKDLMISMCLTAIKRYESEAE